jgi:DNA-binding LytR/AlgR family response regulator
MKNETEISGTIMLKNSKGKLFEHKTTHIVFFETYGNYAYMQKKTGSKEFVDSSLKKLENHPELRLFARISPQNLVNPDFFTNYDQENKMCIIHEKHKLKVSRS